MRRTKSLRGGRAKANFPINTRTVVAFYYFVFVLLLLLLVMENDNRTIRVDKHTAARM